MAKDNNQKLKQLREHAAYRDVKNFAQHLQPLLQANFKIWAKVLKQQKLLSQFRNASDIRELYDLLIPPLSNFLSRIDIEGLKHHFNVCIFMQEIFTEIDKETSMLPCCIAHPEVMFRAVVHMFEIANYAFQKNGADSLKSFQRISLLQVSYRERKFRDALDAGNVILNSSVAKNGRDMNYAVTDIDIDKLIRLAFLYDEMRQVFDLYTYRRGEIVINRRSLVLRKTDHEANLSSTVGSERGADHDQVRATMLGQFELKVHQDCRTITNISNSFFDFLQLVSRSNAASSSRDYFRAFANDLRFEVKQFFDLSIELVTESGRFTVDEIIRAWAFFVTIAMLGQVWNERHVKISKTSKPPGHKITHVPVPELGRNWFIRLLSRETGLSRQQSRCLMNQFTSRPAAKRIDLFYKPLLMMDNNIILLPTPYIRGSRFERNLFALIATETDLDQKKKGYLPVPELEKRFKDAEFQALSNFRVVVNHREVTDIDLVAYKNGILFLGQCKIIIEPDSLYDSWKAEEKLDFAACQLKICMDHLAAIRGTLFERLGLRGIKEQKIVPFILTNTRQFTERRFSGYTVVDIPYLRFLLGGAREGIIGTGDGKIGFGSGRSYIAGKYPTGEELANLFTATIHKVQKREITYRHVMRKIGNRKVHIPMMAMRTAGDAHMLITEGEIFEDER